MAAKTVSVRLSNEEYAALQEGLGGESLSDYVRDAITQKLLRKLDSETEPFPLITILRDLATVETVQRKIESLSAIWHLTHDPQELDKIAAVHTECPGLILDPGISRAIELRRVNELS